MFLFQDNDVTADATNSNIGGTTSAYASAQGIIEQLKDAKNALSNFVIGKNVQTIFDNINRSIVSMEGSAKTLQRSMGGVVTGTDEFREKLIQSYYNTLEIGASFKDITDTVEGLATAMGRIVNPSTQFLQNAVETSKSTGLAAKEVGTMVAEFTKYGGTQEEALDTMHKLANEARKVGINTSGYIKEVNVNMKKINGFGFKTGVDGITQMVKQASILRSTMDKIGAEGFAKDLLDPEKAIEAAAGMQMLGGAVGKLADPFQLMYMAQSDMAGLQDELIKSTKAAFSFNKATGGFDASTEDLYRLREQARITGQNFEDLLAVGKEASKMDYIQNKFSLDGLSEEQKGIVSSLAQIDKGGNVKIDIPGFDEKNKNLEELMKDNNFKTALDQYKVDQLKSEKDIAIEQMTISETQAKDINIIKEAVLKSMGEEGRTNLLTSIENATGDIGSTMAGAASASATATAEGVISANEKISSSIDKYKPDEVETTAFAIGIEKLINLIGSGDAVTPNDAFIPSGGRTMISTGFGKLLPNINDDILMAPNLDSFINKSAKINELLVSNNSGLSNNSNMSGNIDININIGGTVGGDSSNNINKIFENPKVQKQIMDTVLYKLESYKKQQGVLA